MIAKDEVLARTPQRRLGLGAMRECVEQLFWREHTRPQGDARIERFGERLPPPRARSPYRESRMRPSQASRVRRNRRRRIWTRVAAASVSSSGSVVKRPVCSTVVILASFLSEHLRE
jgi:hypothetical protein